MKKILDGIDKVIRWTEDIVSAATLLTIVSIATANTIARYVFSTGFLWADEVNQALLVAMAMFGSARAVRTGGHTEFTSISNKPKSRTVRIAIRAVILIVTVGFLVFLLGLSLQETAKGTMLSTGLKIPRKYYYVSMPIGFTLCVYEYIRIAKSKVLNDSVPEGEKEE